MPPRTIPETYVYVVPDYPQDLYFYGSSAEFVGGFRLFRRG
jgi:hypothetical protein